MHTRSAIVLFIVLGIATLIGSQRATRSDIDMRWLEIKDYSPDSKAYPLDRLGERVDLLLASAGDERLDLALLFADEKLHEAFDMVRIEEAGHAWIAVGLHKDYLERAARQIEAIEENATLRRARFIKALVAHITELAAVYPELPEQIRAFSLIPLVSTTMTAFDSQLEFGSEEERAERLQVREELKVKIDAMRLVDR